MTDDMGAISGSRLFSLSSNDTTNLAVIVSLTNHKKYCFWCCELQAWITGDKGFRSGIICTAVHYVFTFGIEYSRVISVYDLIQL